MNKTVRVVLSPEAEEVYRHLNAKALNSKLERSILNAINKKGFSFVEVISPCPTLYGRKNKMGLGLEMMKYYKDNSVVKHDCDLKDADIQLGGKIVCGDFVNIERPTFSDLLRNGLAATFGHELDETGESACESC